MPRQLHAPRYLGLMFCNQKRPGSRLYYHSNMGRLHTVSLCIICARRGVIPCIVLYTCRIHRRQPKSPIARQGAQRQEGPPLSRTRTRELPITGGFYQLHEQFSLELATRDHGAVCARHTQSCAIPGQAEAASDACICNAQVALGEEKEPHTRSVVARICEGAVATYIACCHRARRGKLLIALCFGFSIALV